MMADFQIVDKKGSLDMNRRAFLLAGAAASVTPVALPPRPARAARPLAQRGGVAYSPMPSCARMTDGRCAFYDDLLKGKIVLINFMYTDCGDIWSGMTQNLVDVQKLLGDAVGRDIFIVLGSPSARARHARAAEGICRDLRRQAGLALPHRGSGGYRAAARRSASPIPTRSRMPISSSIDRMRIGNEPLNR